MRESEEGKEISVFETEDMNEAREKWGQLCDAGKAKYFGFDNGTYIIKGARG